MNGDGPVFSKTLCEIVALKNSGNRVAGSKTDEVRGSEFAKPVGVEFHDGLLGIQDLENLILIGLGIGLDLFLRERRPRDGTAGRIADAAGEVANEEHDGVSQFLKMAHFLHNHGMAEVQIRGRGVEANLHFERGSAGKLFPELAIVNNLRSASLDEGHLLVYIYHRFQILLWMNQAQCPNISGRIFIRRWA